jgi:N-carbamoyl-L-amino-acid hydrolase
VNSVPSHVRLQVDIRDIDPARRDGVMLAVRRDIDEMARRREVTITETLVNADAPAICSAHVAELIDDVCKEHGIKPKYMVSRAYHDSLFMAQVAPIAMVFIPCRGGVSHRPDEYAAPGDIANGARVLAATLARLAME